MDDHMLDRLNSEINLCFMCVLAECKDDEDVTENYNYQAAKVLIRAYNSLVKIYYKPEYIRDKLKDSVENEYCSYVRNNK
jgi:hypothetical protein